MGRKFLLLGLGLWIVASGVVITAGLSQAVGLAVDQALGRYWRTTYDILVRPTGTRSLIEDKYGLVEANFLSGIAGGITIDQYEVIKTIPGVEVAAPIAMIGYGVQFVQTENLGSLSDPGVYSLENTVLVDNGVSTYTTTEIVYFYIGPSRMVSSGPAEGGSIVINPPFAHLGVKGEVDISFLIAGIDPLQETSLIGLEQTLKRGTYLKSEPLVHLPGLPFGRASSAVEIPVLINATPYISIALHCSLNRLLLSPETPDIEAIMTRGGKQYLDNLPREPISVQEVDSDALFRILLEEWHKGYSVLAPVIEALPAPVVYKEAHAPFPYDGQVLEVVVPNSLDLFLGEPVYRECRGPVEVNNAFQMALKGIFDISSLKVEDVNRVPLETYFPPLVTLRYDEMGHPVEPRILRPTRSPCGYIQSPPLILTTLEAARALRGDNCISAIRVRVGGIDELTPQAQRKIEAVASEIHRRTGLDVDIMVGSSPRRILVHVPGIGYVEEQWVQKNVTLSYHRRIQSGHLLLIAALLVTGGLFAADMAWADLLARQPVLALQKALGWRSTTLMGHILRRALLLGAGAGIGGTALAVGALALARQPLPSLPWLAGVPLLVTALSLLGSLYPALQAARVPPIPLLRMAGLRHRPGRERVRGRSGGVLLSARYALRGVVRRWSRSLLAGMTAALSAGLLVLLVGVVVDRAGYLSGTLLGEYILVQVEGYHWWLVGVGMALAAAGMGNSLLAGVLERRREIGVLKALGWRTGAVARLFLLEGAVLGLLGGLAGTALGLAVYLGLYRSVGIGLLWAVLAGLGVPTLVGVLAAAYPARVAAAVAPAEAVRGE
jgi:hypothetical protein